MINRLYLLRCTFVFALLFMTGSLLCSEGEVRIVQRYNIRRHVDGTYIGLVYGYNLSSWNVAQPTANGVRQVRAWHWLVQESASDPSEREKPLSGEYSSIFNINTDGSMQATNSFPAPFTKSFPIAPPANAKTGSVWEAAGELSVDPRNNNVWSKLPIYVEYRWLGEAEWNSRKVIDIRAKYAIRYKTGKDPKADPALSSGEGTRDATIYLDPVTRFPVFIRELVSRESWVYKDGRTIRNDGFILSFFEGSIPLYAADQSASKPAGQSPAPSPVATASAPPSPEASPLPPSSQPSVQPSPSPSPASQMEQIRRELEKNTVDDVTIRSDDRGTSLTLEKLQFVADSAQLVPGEDLRLDRIAEILRSMPADKRFLIIGHTAKIGSEASQKTLSFQRAQSIVESLKYRGIAAGKLLFDGRGGSDAIGDNNTDEGRAKNRRVEIIILH